MALRITGGTLRGRRVPFSDHDLRPTSERARQAYFNIIGSRIEGASFLDLFAGSGIFALEAISRGATAAVAIDVSKKAGAGIQQLARSLEVPVAVIVADVFAGMKRIELSRDVDLVWADPPYDYPRYDDLLAELDRDPRLHEESVVTVEHRSRTLPFDSRRLTRLELSRTATYGEVSMTFFSVANRW